MQFLELGAFEVIEGGKEKLIQKNNFSCPTLKLWNLTLQSPLVPTKGSTLCCLKLFSWNQRKLSPVMSMTVSGLISSSLHFSLLEILLDKPKHYESQEWRTENIFCNKDLSSKIVFFVYVNIMNCTIGVICALCNSSSFWEPHVLSVSVADTWTGKNRVHFPKASAILFGKLYTMFKIMPLWSEIKYIADETFVDP